MGLTRVLGGILFFALLYNPVQALRRPGMWTARASGAQNGTSWANAWTSLSQISGVSAGDTVYLSGGPSGSSRDYPMSIYSAIPVAGYPPAAPLPPPSPIKSPRTRLIMARSYSMGWAETRGWSAA